MDEEWSRRDLLALMCRVFKLGENEWDVDLVNELEQVRVAVDEHPAVPQEPGEVQEAKRRRRTQSEIALKWRQLKLRMLHDFKDSGVSPQDCLLAAIHRLETLKPDDDDALTAHKLSRSLLKLVSIDPFEKTDFDESLYEQLRKQRHQLDVRRTNTANKAQCAVKEKEAVKIVEKQENPKTSVSSMPSA
jgi:hypothetical protein